ncbi:hypothetical protein AB0N09_39870 [Streptomyces erythrochromogenes]|uniref:hypothetical protein n=1 Tax=Streptomyces erythrochromogenes TaxID=285574 RepID=UPI00341844C2
MTSTTLAAGPRTDLVASFGFEPVALPGVPMRDRRACPYCQCNRNSEAPAYRPALRRKG